MCSKDIPGTPAARPSKGTPDIPDIPVIHDIPASPGISTSSIFSRHSPIRMHILQFDWFPQKLHRVPVEDYIINILQTLHSSKKGRCCDIGQSDILLGIELTPIPVLSSVKTNCKNDIQLFHQLFNEQSVSRDYY